MKGSEEGRQYLHRGIANRAFKQSFDLADHVKVTKATLENGLLTVELTREVPETLQPRRIEIGAGAQDALGQGGQNQIGGEPDPGRQGA
jgi:molecular chaperone IbpA